MNYIVFRTREVRGVITIEAATHSFVFDDFDYNAGKNLYIISNLY
jgi:hypothetical protein